MKKQFWENPYQTTMSTSVKEVRGKSVLLNEMIAFSFIKDSVTQSLNQLMNTGLLATSGTLENYQSDSFLDFNSGIQKHNLNDLRIRLSEQVKIDISKREIECLFYLMKGKSARETGTLLNLSQRTVEYYLNCLKEKLHCTRKSELIEAVFNLI